MPVRKRDNVHPCPITQAFVGDEGKSIEEARALQEKLLDGATTGGVSGKINAAARLLVGVSYEQAISAYTAIMTEHPEQRGTCEGQIGAAHYLLGQFEQAITYYEAA